MITASQAIRIRPNWCFFIKLICLIGQAVLMELLQHALAGAFAFAVIVAGTMNAGAYAQYMPLYPELSGEIDLGLILPPTGDPARHGEEILAATRLAVSDFNGYLAGKDVGWSLNLVVEGPQELPTSSLDRL